MLEVLRYNLSAMKTSNKQKVAVGLSGGVDSAVSAYLLKEQSYEVVGVYMQCWDEKADGCRAEEDRADAAKVAAHLGIKFQHLNFIKEYKSKVIDYFYAEYKLGRTPNPDVLCNKEIKFGMFLEWAMKEGFDFVATGHYARVEKVGEGKSARFKLLKGVDETKDQSYFLYLLNQKQLSKTIFPVGGMKKKEIRKIAKKVGFHNAEKPDSAGICFIGEVDIKDFLKRRLKAKVGKLVTKDGEIVGEHDGVWFYTVGQRHGFRVNRYFGLPLYVIGKNVKKNELIVGFAKDGRRDEFEVENLHWINDQPAADFKADVRIRHLGELYPARISLRQKLCLVKLENSVFGVAPGQSAVFYVGDEALGGGIIK